MPPILHRLHSVAILLPALLLTACAKQPVVGATDKPGPPPLASSKVIAWQLQAQRQKMAAERCSRERPALEELMAELRQAEGELANEKQAMYEPLPPPPPWDEAMESRFRQEDRDLDWARHLEAQETWRRKERIRLSQWEDAHQERLGAAQLRLDQLARDLRLRRPTLFTGPGSIEFDPVAVDAIRRCGASESNS